MIMECSIIMATLFVRVNGHTVIFSNLLQYRCKIHKEFRNLSEFVYKFIIINQRSYVKAKALQSSKSKGVYRTQSNINYELFCENS